MGFKFQDGRIYEMPVFFGPSPLPKNPYPDGTFQLNKPADIEAATVMFETDPARLEELLPEGFSLVAPVVSVAVCEFGNIGSYAGNTYYLINISTPVRFDGERDHVRGDLVLAMYENRADPIIGGRELLGYSKIYAECLSTPLGVSKASPQLGTKAYKVLEHRRIPDETRGNEIMTVERKKYCVYGEWRESKTDTYMPVTDSSTGEVIAEVPRCTKDEVNEAITSAAEAFESWSKLSLSKRVQMMFKWRDVLQDHLDELAVLCSKEVGKNLSEARGDVLKAIEPTELACALPYAVQGSGAMQVTTGFDCNTYRMPLGVVAGIVPFNFPAMIPWGWMVPLAVATGNTVVLKAASPTPLTAMRILELFYGEAGFPKGVVNLVTCTHEEADLLLTDERVKAVTFVGTTRVGKLIYSTAAANGKRVQAQCEAKNHALVLADCDLDATTSAISIPASVVPECDAWPFPLSASRRASPMSSSRCSRKRRRISSSDAPMTPRRISAPWSRKPTRTRSASGLRRASRKAPTSFWMGVAAPSPALRAGSSWGPRLQERDYHLHAHR